MGVHLLQYLFPVSPYNMSHSKNAINRKGGSGELVQLLQFMNYREAGYWPPNFDFTNKYIELFLIFNIVFEGKKKKIPQR